MNVLLIDNYDSFTFNIVALLRQLHIREYSVLKNDEVNSETAAAFDKLIISPGPAIPSESGNILDIIKTLSPTHSILGICLGHQAIAEAFGGKLRNEMVPYHGFQTTIEIAKTHSIFRGLDAYIKANRPKAEGRSLMSFKAGLYHSWSVDENEFPDCLEITSYSTEGNIMSLKHKTFDVHGIQFHPESYMTEYGKEILANFLLTA